MKNPILLALLLSAPLHASTILIDFGPEETTGTSPTWNNFTGTTAGASLALVETTGVTTGYAITLSGTVNTLGDNTSATTVSYDPFTPASVKRDVIYQSTARNLTLSGLDPSVSYTLTFFSYVDRDSPRDTTVSIPGKSTLTLHPSGVPTAASDSGGDLGTIADVSPTGAGDIVITLNNVHTNWILSGMQITYTIPEPSALICAMGGLALCVRRNRRSDGA